jgi:hypothetical protein
MRTRIVVAIGLLVLAGSMTGWDRIAQAKAQKLCFDCARDGGCIPGPDCCITIECSNGPWYSCLGGGKK